SAQLWCAWPGRGRTASERSGHSGTKKIVLVTSMPVPEVSDMLSTKRPPAGPRDYLQAYLEYARTLSDEKAPASRALLGRLVTERSPERERNQGEYDGFSRAVEEFLR